MLRKTKTQVQRREKTHVRICWPEKTLEKSVWCPELKPQKGLPVTWLTGGRKCTFFVTWPLPLHQTHYLLFGLCKNPKSHPLDKVQLLLHRSCPEQVCGVVGSSGVISLVISSSSSSVCRAERINCPSARLPSGTKILPFSLTWRPMDGHSNTRLRWISCAFWRLISSYLGE